MVLNDDIRLEVMMIRRFVLLCYIFNLIFLIKLMISFDWIEDLFNLFRGMGNVKIVKDLNGKV